MGKLIDKEDAELERSGLMDMKPQIPAVLRLKIALDAVLQIEKLVNVEKKLHRDIKVDNFIPDLTHQKTSLIDYGNVGDLDQNNNCVEGDLLGTAIYFAPELRAERLKYMDEPSHVPQF